MDQTGVGVGMLAGVGTIGLGIVGMDQTGVGVGIAGTDQIGAGVGITIGTTIGIMAMEEEEQTKTTLWVADIQTAAILLLEIQEEEEQLLVQETLHLELQETIPFQDLQLQEQEIQTLQPKLEITPFVLPLLLLETIQNLQEVILIQEHALIQILEAAEVLLVDLAVAEAMVAEAEDHLAEAEDVNKFYSHETKKSHGFLLKNNCYYEKIHFNHSFRIINT